MLSKKQLIKRSLHFVLSVNLVFYSLAPAFSTPVFASTETAENKQTTVISKEVSNIAPVDRPIDIEPVPEPVIRPIDIGQIKPLEIMPNTGSTKEKPDEQVLLDAPGTVPLDMYDNRDNAGKKPSDPVGQYNVDEFTGLFSYSYPLQIPAGRNNLQPTVNLQYNHRQQNLGSFVGFGWELNMPSISRDNRSGVDKLYIDNYFRLNLSGSDILEPISIDANGYGVYGKKIESDFLKIEFASSSNSWIVTDKLGVIYTFGSTTASRQDNPNDNTQIYQWMLEEIRDTNDNFIRYEYYKDAGQIYPKKIFYTGHGITDGIFEVAFEPFANGTPIENNLKTISYQTGFAVETKYLLDRVDLKIDNQLVTYYQLDLQLNEKENKYLLKKITPTFYQDAQEFVKDQLDFKYSYQGVSYTLDDGDLYTLPDGNVLGENVLTFDSKRDMFIDVDGDSLVDYINIYCSNNNISVNVWKNDGGGNWLTSEYSQNVGSAPSCGSLYGVINSVPVAFANLNGDHFIDMVTDNLLYINTGSGWQTQQSNLPVSLFQSTSPGQVPMNIVMFQDMNNDSYDDIVYQYHPSNSTANIEVYIKNITTNTWLLNNNYNLSVNLDRSDCLIYGGDPYAFVDYNNDGLLDVFYKFYCGFFQDPPHGEGVYLNSGNGFVSTNDYSPITIVSNSNNSSSIEQDVDFFSDLDSDGIFDYGRYYRRKWTTVSNHWSQGSLDFFNQQIFNTGILASNTYFNNSLPVAIADLNGDHIQDVMHSWGNVSEIYLARGVKNDILDQVEYSSGVKMYINYTTSGKERNTDGSLSNPDLPFDLQVVKDIVVDNGFSELAGYQYQYSNGKSTNYPEEKIKDIYGFASVEKKIGQAAPDVDLGDGSDGVFLSTGNETWTTTKNFTSLHIQSGHTITVEPDVIIKVQGGVIIDGNLSADGMGYSGGAICEYIGCDGSGPGAGHGGYAHPYIMGSGGGGAHATDGSNGYTTNHGYSYGGLAYGFENLEPIFMGSGGGSGQGGAGYSYGGAGGAGGGIIQLFAHSIEVNGRISANGQDGYPGMNLGDSYSGGGGAGSGGSIYLKAANIVNINNTSLVSALGGVGGIGGWPTINSGGAGGNGRIRIESSQISGITNPVYYSKHEFRYSIDNLYYNPDLQKQISYYHTAKDDGLYLHGKPKMFEKYDADDHLVNKSFITWQEENLDGDRKFVYNDQKINTNVDVVLDYGAIEFSADQNTSLLFHMNGLPGSLEKKSEVVQEFSDLIEYNNISSDYGFDGAANGAYSFDGVDDYLKTTTQADVNFSVNNFTIEAWVKTDSDGMVLRKWEDAGNVPGWMLNINEDGYARFTISQGNDPGVQAIGNVDLRDNEWHYLAGVRQGMNIYLYVDGELAGSNTTYQVFNVNSLGEIHIGQRSSFNYFDGSIDEVRVAAIARSASEIHNYYNYITVNSFYNSTATQSDYDLTNGNLLAENNLGQVELNTNTGEILDILAGDEKTTTYEYAQNTTKHILSAPKEKVIADNADTKSQELYYDDLAFGQVNKVNLTKEDYLVDNVEINREFNDLGLVVAETDPENNVSEIIYDEYDLYPSETVNSLNQITYTDYNLLNSQVATSTAANGAMTVNSFDAFGRLIKTQISSPSSTTELLTKQEIVYQDFEFPRYKEVKDYFDVNQYKIQREYYDGLDRVIQTKSQTSNSTQWSTQDIAYDALGRVVRQSLPYISQNIDYSEPDLQQVAKTYTYDALDRVLTEATPVGTTTYSYDGLTTSIYDANNNRKDLVKDAYGNLVQVKEYNGQDIYTTNYEYTLTNKLSKITDALGNIRNFVYDDLDNLVSQDMIHRPNAQSIPSMNYTYDKNGNVLTQTNFNNQTISYTYDDLNRVLTESVNGAIKTTYTYDQGANNVGKLTYINYNHNGNWQSYNYNLLNQLTDYDVRIHGDNYAMNYSYNLDSNLKQIDYPNNKQANYSFNNIGQVSSLSVASSTIASNLQYNVNGQLTHLERANGLITDYSYTPSQAYRLTNLNTTNASSTLQDISYTYDAVGNILNITDDADTDLAKSATYFYDDLNRLASTTVSYVNIPNSNYNQSFSYDAIGNILTNSSLGSYSYTNNNPQQLSSVPSQNFTYDNAGNLLSDSQKTLTWDWRSRMIKSKNTGSQNISNYTYDANNQRLMKQTQEPVEIILPLKSGSSGINNGLSGANPPPPVQYTTIAEEHYIDQYFERNDINNDTKDHVFLNGQKVATINNNNAPYYIISDHLNSSSILVDNAGNIAEVSDYRPFGSEAYNHTITDLKNDYNFTGHEYDEESSLQYYGARYMDNNIGRFVSVDPATLVLGNSSQFKNSYGMTLQEYLADPQNLNSYTYSRNNPIILVDPDGQSWKTFGQGLASPFVYAYNNPLQTVGILAAGAAVAIAAPAVAVAAGATLGAVAIGSAVGNAISAPDADTRDYYLGQGATAAVLTGFGLKGVNSSKVFNKQTPTSGLPDSAFVCRGGTCNAGQFEVGNGTSLIDGKLTNISVQSATNMSIEQLSKNLPNGQIGATTVGQVRNLGGNVMSTPTLQNSYHSTLQGITPRQAQSLFQPTIRNPWR